MKKNFEFIVNERRYSTCRLIADLLSPLINQLHNFDPTINEFYIQTKNNGNFQHILDLINFNENNIPESEIPFVSEVLKKLDNDSIQIDFHKIQITTSNAFEFLQKHQDYGQFYSPQLQKEIDFASSNFYQLNVEEINDLKISIIEKIICNKKLRLESEDQLLSLINKLYSDNSSLFYLYEYVEFVNTSQSAIK